MKYLLLSISLILLLASCQDTAKDKPSKHLTLSSKEPNSATLTDTLMIVDMACRGCAYENTTTFSISDSMDLVELVSVRTTDTNPPGTDGGIVRKELILFPKNKGKTIFRVYKILSPETASVDSTRFVNYQLEIRD